MPKWISGESHEVILRLRSRQWACIDIICFRWHRLLPTHFRRLIKGKIREFTQQPPLGRRHLRLFLLGRRRQRVSRKITQHLCRRPAFKTGANRLAIIREGRLICPGDWGGGLGRIAQLVEQRTENPSNCRSKALQSVSFSDSIMKFCEGRFHFQGFWQHFCSVPALNLQK